MSARTDWLSSDANPDVEVRDAWRAKLARRANGDTTPSNPGLATTIRNVVGAANRVIHAALQGQPVFADKDEAARRLAICESNVCGVYDATNGRCISCTCFVKWKTSLSTEQGKCPKALW
jgi:hypothetical protein